MSLCCKLLVVSALALMAAPCIADPLCSGASDIVQLLQRHMSVTRRAQEIGPTNTSAHASGGGSASVLLGLPSLQKEKLSAGVFGGSVIDPTTWLNKYSFAVAIQGAIDVDDQGALVDEWQGFCSGAYLGSYLHEVTEPSLLHEAGSWAVVLTAHHCKEAYMNGEGDAKALRVGTANGYLGGLGGLHRWEHDATRMGYDIAVLLIKVEDESVLTDLQPAAVARTHLKTGQMIRLFGFGQPRSGKPQLSSENQVIGHFVDPIEDHVAPGTYLAQAVVSQRSGGKGRQVFDDPEVQDPEGLVPRWVKDVNDPSAFHRQGGAGDSGGAWFTVADGRPILWGVHQGRLGAEAIVETAAVPKMFSQDKEFYDALSFYEPVNAQPPSTEQECSIEGCDPEYMPQILRPGRPGKHINLKKLEACMKQCADKTDCHWDYENGCEPGDGGWS